MKLTQTGLPFSFARSSVSPPSRGSTSFGAGWPTWNWPAIGERGGSVGRGVGDASVGAASDGSGTEDAGVGAADVRTDGAVEGGADGRDGTTDGTGEACATS